MNPSSNAVFFGAGLAAAILLAVPRAAWATDPALKLVGVWEAKRHFGPDIHGPLLIERRDGNWSADVGGMHLPVRDSGGYLQFEVPDDKGSFVGRLDATKHRIVGHWTQPRTASSGCRYASPVRLTASGPNIFRGEIVPLADGFTMFLDISRQDDGTAGAFIRNPDRNVGVFVNISRVTYDNGRVELHGRFRGQTGDSVLVTGTYDSDNQVLSLYFPFFHGTYDFTRVTDAHSDFYARPKGERYAYHAPPALDDGWAVASLDDVGINLEPLQRMIETKIEAPVHDVHASYIHGLLIARQGKLVMEEYFHGFDRDTPHDTRSASKSLAATLAGAAIEHGAPLTLDTPVYDAMHYDGDLSGAAAGKRAITLRHLLTMSSGLDCNDGDDHSLGNEEVMQSQQAQPDWYRYTLDLALKRKPGASAYYCSAGANLVGGVVQQATGRPLAELFDEWIAGPLQMGRYYLNLTPTGEPYMGGGIYWLPRDFIKLGQAYLNGGTFHGRRIVSESFAREATTKEQMIGDRSYGYLWWVRSYPCHGRQVAAYFAGGNGTQLVIVVPELQLVIGFFGGNYSDAVLFIPQREWVPQFILPAVEE